MADIGRVRIRLPASIKQGEVVKVRVLVIHPMEIVGNGAVGSRTSG